MQALVEVMLVHKTDDIVAQQAAGTLCDICANGVWLLKDHDFVPFKQIATLFNTSVISFC